MEGHESHSESGERYRYRNVTVLLSSDVSRQNDLVFMPNTIEMGILRKTDKGQYVNGIKFSDSMSEEDVKRRLILHFPKLENQSFYCASAVDNRTRLEFHGERRVWDGQFMKKTLQGNSALYIFTEMTVSEWSKTLPQRPTVHTQSRHFASQKSGKRKNDESAYTALCKRTKKCSAIVVSPFGNSSTPMPLYPVNLLPFGPQEHPTTTTTTAQNNISSQNFCLSKFSKATGSQKYAFPVAHTRTKISSTNVPCHWTQASGGILPSVPAHATVGSQCGFQAAERHNIYVPEMPGAATNNDISLSPVVPSQSQIGLGQLPSASLAYNTAGDLISQNTQTSGATLTESGILHNDPSQQTAATAYPPPISYEVRRSVKISNNFSDSAYESSIGDASGVDDNTEYPIEAASCHIAGIECYLQNSQMDGPSEGSSSEEIDLNRIATHDQMGLSERELNKIYQDVIGIPLFEPVIRILCPNEGPITGGTKFVIYLNVNGIPEKVTSFRALFKGVGFANLTPVTEGTGVYTGLSPASEVLGKVAVTVSSLDGTWNSPDETEFEYHPNITQELQKLISKMPDTKSKIPLDYQTLNPSRSEGTVCSPSSFSSLVVRSSMVDESKDISSLKALQCILFAAAATNDRECIEIIFSTSAGEAVFQTYRNSSILPEDIARAREHHDLAEYLQNVHKRLSEEIVCNVETVTIDWVELKRATAKKDIFSGTDESEGLESESFLESDDDQSSYFADDETSICQSPSTSEFSNEDECIESKFFDSRNDDQVKIAKDRELSSNLEVKDSTLEEIINVSSRVNQEGASPGVTISPVSVITTVPVAGEVLNPTVGAFEGVANGRAVLHSQEPFGFTVTAPLSEDRDSAQSLNSPFIEKKVERGKGDGKKCSTCSGCPLGFGLKEPCSKTKNTECQPCIPVCDYSNSTGMEECIKCDTYSNCSPGRSKKITKCTIFSGHTCDGCEEGYYHNKEVGCDKCSAKCNAATEDEIQACKTEHNRVCAPKRVLPKTPPAFSNVKKDGCEEGYYYRQDVGCDKCSPKCDATTEDEIQACTTKQNRVCAPKRVLPKTPPIFSNDSKGGHPNNTTNDKDDEIPLIGPELEESKTNQPREENLIVEKQWPWVSLIVIELLVVTGLIGFYKRGSRRNRLGQPEGDVNTHNTEENIALREQTIPLITEGGVDAHDTIETFSLGPRRELGGVDAPEPSSEELSRQKGLDRQIETLTIKELKKIVDDLNRSAAEGRFMWQRLGKELGIEYESERWEGVQNPIEYLLKAYGEKEGSSIRGLIEATRRSGLKQCATWNEFLDKPENEEAEKEEHVDSELTNKTS